MIFNHEPDIPARPGSCVGQPYDRQIHGLGNINGDRSRATEIARPMTAVPDSFHSTQYRQPSNVPPSYAAATQGRVVPPLSTVSGRLATAVDKRPLAHMSDSEIMNLVHKQHAQIERQQHSLAAQEQRIKYFRQQEAHFRHMFENEATRGRRHRTLKANEPSLRSDLVSIRSLFAEKERELSVAVGRVDDLRKQVDILKSSAIDNCQRDFNNNVSHNNYLVQQNRKRRLIRDLTQELERLRRDLTYKKALNEEENYTIEDQRSQISRCQDEIIKVDNRIVELQGRLVKKAAVRQSARLPTAPSATVTSSAATNVSATTNTALPGGAARPPSSFSGRSHKPVSTVEPFGRPQLTSPVAVIAASPTAVQISTVTTASLPVSESTAMTTSVAKPLASAPTIGRALPRPALPPKPTSVLPSSSTSDQSPSGATVGPSLYANSDVNINVVSVATVQDVLESESARPQPSQSAQPMAPSVIVEQQPAILPSIDRVDSSELAQAPLVDSDGTALSGSEITPSVLDVSSSMNENPNATSGDNDDDDDEDDLLDMFGRIIVTDAVTGNQVMMTSAEIAKAAAQAEAVRLSKYVVPEVIWDTTITYPGSHPVQPPVSILLSTSSEEGDVIRKREFKSTDSTVSFDPLALLLDAALEGELELVEQTAAQVTDPSASNDEGITALHNAICAGHSHIVRFLVHFGCDVNAEDADGWTPLHCAASCNNLPVVKFLVEHGAALFATTHSDQETAAEKCEEGEKGFLCCSDYLLNVQQQMGGQAASGDRQANVFAVFDYEAVENDELSFRVGEAFRVDRPGDEVESDWWYVTRVQTDKDNGGNESSSPDGECGYVPVNYLGLFPRISGCRDGSTEHDCEPMIDLHEDSEDQQESICSGEMIERPSVDDGDHQVEVSVDGGHDVSVSEDHAEQRKGEDLAAKYTNILMDGPSAVSAAVSVTSVISTPSGSPHCTVTAES